MTASLNSTKLQEPRKTVHLLGLPFDAVTLAETVGMVRHACLTRERLFLTTVNVNFVVAAQKDEGFRRSIVNSDLCVADGQPIVLASRLLGVPLPERVAGADIFDALRRHTGPPINVYFFGGLPGIAERAFQILNSEEGGVRCTGFQSPGFGSVESMSTHEQIDHINATKPDFVVVAIGATKGQAWIEHNRSRLEAPVISYFGAVVNFVAGTVPRSPVWLRRIGMEWLWRVKEEPVLMRRYVIDGVMLLRLVSVALVQRLMKDLRDAH